MTAFLPATLLLTLAAPPPAQAPDRAVESYIGEEVAAIVHLNLERLDLDRLAKGILGDAALDEEADQILGVARQWLDSLKDSGARDLYVLLDPRDLPGLPVAIVPLADGVDAKAIGRVLCGEDGDPNAHGGGPIVWPTCAVVDDAVFAGTDKALERLRSNRPASRPELTEALKEASSAPVRILLVPSASQRRSFEELTPTLPRELGGGPITSLTRGLCWMVLILDAETSPTLRLVTQAEDAQATQGLSTFLARGIDLLKQAIGSMPPRSPGREGLLAGLQDVAPRVDGDRITVALSPEAVATVVGEALGSARDAARRSQSVNNLKQIGLALHNYAQGNKSSFPPVAFTAEDGTPLLSWRVAILPYIEQKALFDEFHLDEPWDSPHNKALIERMPPTYANPMLPTREAASGKTVYLAPRGKETIFPKGGQGTGFREIRDGTSNTILVVEANADQAVIWTKPDEFDVGDEVDVDALFGLYAQGGTDVLFADGSVRFLKNTINAMVLKALFTAKGGEVIDFSQLP